MTIGEKIKKYRIEQKLTQEYLAEKLCVSRQAVSKWENGKTLPNMENLIELANIFQIPLSELTDTREIPEDTTPHKSQKRISAIMIGIACLAIIFVFYGKIGKWSIFETFFRPEVEAVIAPDDVAEENNSRLTFSDYTGYLDDCIECNQSSNFTGADYDGDGLTDRVYRTVVEDEQAMYKIEFGNGEVLELEDKMPDGGFPYILNGDFTGDNKNDIVFGVMHGDSTDPQAYGEVAFFIRTEVGYKSLRTLENENGEYHNVKWGRVSTAPFFKNFMSVN